MTSASRPTFFRHFGRSMPQSGPDLADMGTAFALDQAMDLAQDAAPAPGDPPQAPVVFPVAPWRLWLGRKLGV